MAFLPYFLCIHFKQQNGMHVKKHEKITALKSSSFISSCTMIIITLPLQCLSCINFILLILYLIHMEISSSSIYNFLLFSIELGEREKDVYYSYQRNVRFSSGHERKRICHLIFLIVVIITEHPLEQLLSLYYSVRFLSFFFDYLLLQHFNLFHWTQETGTQKTTLRTQILDQSGSNEKTQLTEIPQHMKV